MSSNSPQFIIKVGWVGYIRRYNQTTPIVYTSWCTLYTVHLCSAAGVHRTPAVHQLSCLSYIVHMQSARPHLNAKKANHCLLLLSFVSNFSSRTQTRLPPPFASRYPSLSLSLSPPRPIPQHRSCPPPLPPPCLHPPGKNQSSQASQPSQSPRHSLTSPFPNRPKRNSRSETPPPSPLSLPQKGPT